MSDGHATDFLRERGCEVTAGELVEFLAHAAGHGEPLELSDDDLMDVAGGTMMTDTAYCTEGKSTCGCTFSCMRNCR